jgi:hypothetical protein
MPKNSKTRHHLHLVQSAPAASPPHNLKRRDPSRMTSPFSAYHTDYDSQVDDKQFVQEIMGRGGSRTLDDLGMEVCPGYWVKED